jgi:aminoglycoside 6'-N-acetyltransferase
VEPLALPTLTEGALTLRALRENDLHALVAMVSAPGVAEWWGDVNDIARIRDGLHNDGCAFAIEVGGELAGWLGFSEELEPEYRSAGLDIALAPRHQDRGHGRRALLLAARWLIDERGHHRLTIDPALENARAIHVYEAVGFRPVGVLRRCERRIDGTWRDGLLMDLLAEELGRPPSP